MHIIKKKSFEKMIFQVKDNGGAVYPVNDLHDRFCPLHASFSLAQRPVFVFARTIKIQTNKPLFSSSTSLSGKYFSSFCCGFVFVDTSPVRAAY